ncbi:MAG: TonB-dependent receptor [Bacteroidales bacterium]|jgi:outer membrane receptor protein involved in Fe transport|nr:TonB-dependent receptor [Bacteroidales bacterium]
MREKIIILLLFLLYVGSLCPLYAQQDTLIRQLEPIEVKAIPEFIVVSSAVPLFQLQKSDFFTLPVKQLSEAVRFIPGITIKDYGGIGSMKTVVVHGISAQHTSIAYDGMPVSDASTGQIDLGKYPLDYIDKLSFSNSVGHQLFCPASLLAASNLLWIERNVPFFKDDKKINFKVNMTVGSFDYVNPSFLLENILYSGKKKDQFALFSSLQLNYSSATGQFSYTVHYGNVGDSSAVKRRHNADVEQLSGEANLFALFGKKAKMTLKYLFYHSERGLPGAVIFYNDRSTQRLWDNSHTLQFHFDYHFKHHFDYQLNIKYQNAYQRYLDPEFLNIEGKLDNHYRQQEYFCSNALLYKPFQYLSFSLSNDLIFNAMESNMHNFTHPDRFSSYTALGSSLSFSVIKANVGVVHIYSKMSTIQESSGDHNHFSPFVSLILKPLRNEDFYIRLSYKNSYRLPTFNELFYTETGSRALQPEQAEQVIGGLTYSKLLLQKKMHLSFTSDFFFYHVKDKIVAIPNKNLFIWSIINFGKAQILGNDIGLELFYDVNKCVSMRISANYTYQNATDRSDKINKTYGHLLPYIPLHTASGYVTVSTTWIDLTYTLIISGSRYALPQNSETNLLPRYCEQSITLSRTIDCKAFKIEVKFEVLNLADTQYEVVKNYPMQGRSFRGTLSFKN